MKLLDNFYKITDRETMRCKVSMNENHEIYKAHFPNNPVTPGVCIVQMATEMLEILTGQKLTLVEINKIRYLAMISPSDKPWFSFEPVASVEGNYKVKIIVSDGEKTFTQMTINYKSSDK